VLTGYTQLRLVAGARDAGANVVVKKPLSPRTLFDHIVWVARVNRPFIETADYAGPDRRFRDRTPPDGSYKRDGDRERLAHEQANETENLAVGKEALETIAP
jgi:two-component system chemotaxis response regulator CheY